MKKGYTERPMNGGIQRIFRFKNGFGASVIKGPFSYGGDSGLWELAVVKLEPGKDEFHITYETPITSDVEGYLTEEKVDELLGDIERLEVKNG